MACLGPAVLFCPCDGREVWHGDFEEGDEIVAPHADDHYDQEGTPLRSISSKLKVPAVEQQGVRAPAAAVTAAAPPVEAPLTAAPATELEA